MPSNTCCRPPGLSTDSRERTTRKTTIRKANTSTSMATKFGIGASGYFGATGIWSVPCSALSSAVTGPAKALFKSLVKKSCSGIENQSSVVGFWQRQSRQTLRGLGSVCQSHITFIYRFTQHGRNGQKQARKQAIQALAGNSKYNKRDYGHQK